MCRMEWMDANWAVMDIAIRHEERRTMMTLWIPHNSSLHARRVSVFHLHFASQLGPFSHLFLLHFSSF